MKQPASVVRILTGLLAAFLLGGCSSLYIYNETRDKQAQAAKTAFDGLELQKSIDTERTNLDALLAQELTTQDKLAQGIRDFILKAMLTKTVQAGLVTPINERLINLIGTAPILVNPDGTAMAPDVALKKKEAAAQAARKKIEAANVLQQKEQGRELSQATAKRQLILYNINTPSCESFKALGKDKLTPELERRLAALDQKHQIIARGLAETYRDNCGQTNNFESPYSKADVSSEMGVAWQRHQYDMANLDAKKAQIGNLQAAFADAQAAVDEANKKTTEDANALVKVQTAATKVQEALEALKTGGIDNIEKLNNPYLLKLLSEERIKSLESFLSAVTEYEPDKPLPESASRAVMLGTLLPNLIDQSKTALAAAKKPLVTPYILELNYHQLNLEAAKRDIAASEAIVEHSGQILDVLLYQAQQLRLAHDELDAAIVADPRNPQKTEVVATKYASRNLALAFKEASPSEQHQLYSATSRYLDSLNRLDAKRYKLEYIRVADFHNRSLAYADINTKQWESLIGTSVGQLKEYGAGGIKPEQAAGFINTLMLFWIGIGVN